jgi:hypothetical protein
VQSEPYAHSGYSEPGPPSSHAASEAQVHVSKQIAGTEGGEGGGGGGARGEKNNEQKRPRKWSRIAAMSIPV